MAILEANYFVATTSQDKHDIKCHSMTDTWARKYDSLR